MCHFPSAIGLPRFASLLFKLAPAALPAFLPAGAPLLRRVRSNCHFSGNGVANRLIGGIELEVIASVSARAEGRAGAAGIGPSAGLLPSRRGRPRNRLLSRPGSEAGLIGPRDTTVHHSQEIARQRLPHR